MNKKFSTLVAAILVAGAWTTLDAKIIKVDAPKVEGSYLMGTAVTVGDVAVGEVTNLVTGVAGITGDSKVTAFGNEWTFEKTTVTGVSNAFFLKNSKGQYLVEGAGTGALALGASGAALAFYYDGTNKQIKLAEAGVDASYGVDYILDVSAASALVVVQNSPAAAVNSFATFTAEDSYTIGDPGLSQTVPLVSNIKGDEYYFIGSNDSKLLYNSSGTTDVEGTLTNITEANVNDYLWKVQSSVVNDKYVYKFVNKANNKLVASIDGITEFTSDIPYTNGFTLYLGDKPLKKDFTAGTLVTDAAAFGLYKSAITSIDGLVLNTLLNGGFNLTIKLTKDSKATVEDTGAFDGKLTAVDVSTGDVLTAAATEFRIKSGKKFLVLNTKKGATSEDGVEGLFELVDDPAAKTEYLSVFRLGNYSGTSSNEVATLEVAKAAGMVDFRTGYIITVAGKNYLRTKKNIVADDVLPYITTSASEIASYKTFIGKYMNIAFVSDDSEDSKDIVYKKNGVLATAYYDNIIAADYVNKNTVLLSSPEAQWVVSEVSNEDKNEFTLMNRESQEEITGVILRKTSVANQYIVEKASAPSNLENDVVTIIFVEKTTKFDGFRTATANGLRNQAFHIGQYHNETGNTAAYWVENHQTNGSHQLGVTADVVGAAKWTLSLDQKLKDNAVLAEIDTVFIYTPMASIQDNKLVNGDLSNEDAVCDTLAILPYQIQNRANLEYVTFENGTNLKYYVCHNKADERTDDRFALKMKPNGTFNIVTLPNRQDDARATKLGTEKIYVANSTQWGSLKQIKTYSTDDNSLMVVTPIDKPEYRKVVKAWGDTVRIYRNEYPTEVLFEKRDAKSVVDKDTLSFLNVSNSVTTANPALFVDTAYVNRVDADGTVNTCYQYLLAVNVDEANSAHCPYNPLHNTQEWKDKYNNGKPCADASENRAVKGRFLINLVDTAFAYKQDHLHNNPYVNNVEANENLAKLSFVEGIHSNDTLYITRKGGEVVKLAMNDPAFNVAKFAFRYVDNEAGSFKIQTRFKDYKATTKELFEGSANDDGYLRWVNGTIVVTNSYLNGEEFNMEEGFAGDPVANDNINASEVSVVSGEGFVTINGAAGKTVVITNVLGQTIANTIISSDRADITVPAGVVVVAVEGEAAVKAIVK